MKEELIQELKERLEFYERHKRSFPGEADWADSKIELLYKLITVANEAIFPEYSPFRRSGRTTRLADRLIQELFKNGEVYCKEERSNKHIFKTVSNRLMLEHGGRIFEFDEMIYKITLIGHDNNTHIPQDS